MVSGVPAASTSAAFTGAAAGGKVVGIESVVVMGVAGVMGVVGMGLLW